MKARILAAVACAVVVLPAHAADVMVASQVYRSCRAPKQSSTYIYCRAYIGGYFDGFRVGMEANRPNEFCPSPGLTTEQIWRKVEPSLKPRREWLIDELTVTVLADNLIRAYRCKEGNSSSTKRADTKPQSELYAACQAPKKSSSHTFCRGYLEGHLDGLTTGLAGMTPMQFCPEAHTAEQIWETVAPFLKPRQGQFGDEAADTVLSETLLSFYPCEKPK
jgi:hypothetical protein